MSRNFDIFGTKAQSVLGISYAVNQSWCIVKTDIASVQPLSKELTEGRLVDQETVRLEALLGNASLLLWKGVGEFPGISKRPRSCGKSVLL